MLHVLPFNIRVYPSICNRDASALSDNQVSCRHITLNLQFRAFHCFIFILN